MKPTQQAALCRGLAKEKRRTRAEVYSVALHSFTFLILFSPVLTPAGEGSSDAVVCASGQKCQTVGKESPLPQPSLKEQAKEHFR